MKSNTRSGTVYTNQGGAAQAGPYPKAGRPIVERAVKNLTPLGAGQAQPSRICTQDVATSIEYSRTDGRDIFAPPEIFDVLGHQTARLRTSAKDQAAEAESLSVSPQYVRFAILATLHTIGGTPATNGFGVTRERDFSATGENGVDLLRLCKGVGHVASTTLSNT